MSPTLWRRVGELWTKIARFAKALEGIDDPAGDYMFSLAKRVDKLERDLAYLERQLHPRADGDAVSVPGERIRSRLGASDLG